MALALRLRAGRRTNLALLLLLAAAVVTGSLAFAIGGSWVPWAVVAHGVAGLGLVALAPWKSAISARGLRRRRPGIAMSFALAASIVVTIVTGIGHSTGLLVSLGLSAMQLHVGAAVASMPLALWHVLARKTVPHRTDVSRRNLLRGGVLVGGAAAGYVAIEGLLLVGGLPGHARRSTGSYERGSFQPDEMPVTQWLNDAVPAVDPQTWTLRIADAVGDRDVGYEELVAHRSTVRAALDWGHAQVPVETSPSVVTVVLSSIPSGNAGRDTRWARSAHPLEEAMRWLMSITSSRSPGFKASRKIGRTRVRSRSSLGAGGLSGRRRPPVELLGSQCSRTFDHEKVDRSTLKLVGACATGQHFLEAVLTARRAEPANISFDFLVIKLSDVTIPRVETMARMPGPSRSMPSRSSSARSNTLTRRRR